jgi:amidohydrolase
MTIDILKQAQKIKVWGVKHRRYLHQHPELSGCEKNTSLYCQKILKELGYTVKQYENFGFIADLDIQNANKRIAFRADMDALAIRECNEHEYVSKNPGVAHMCGHDAHMAIALMAAKLLVENKDQVKVSLRFIFQPHEEELPGGSLEMIKQGCLEGVDEIYGLHNASNLQVGELATSVGALTAASHTFDVVVRGKSCHAARPEEGLDPLYAVTKMITDWKTNIAEFIKPAVFGVTTVASGDAINVIPHVAKFSGIFRVFDQSTEEYIKQYIDKDLVGLRSQGYGCEIEYHAGYDALVNGEYGVGRVISAAKNFLNVNNINDKVGPFTFAEDFCYYLQHKPGAFFLLGCGNVEKGIVAPVHSANFDIDEDVIPIGAAIFCELVFGL